MPGKFDINPETGKQYGVNPSTGVQDDNYWAQVVEPRFRSSSSGVGNINDLVKQQLELQKQVNAPAVQSLEASIPETQQRFATQRTQLEGQKEPLKKRYTNLLDELKRRETVEIGAVQQRNKAEYSARGIPLSSTAYTDANLQATQPISQFYTGQTKDVGLDQEEGLSGLNNLIATLTGQETEATRSIQNAIAQLQAGGGQNAISSAMQLFGQQQQQALAEQQMSAQAQQQAIENALKQSALELETRRTNYETGKPYSTSGSGIDLTGLIAALGGNVQGTSTGTPSSFQSATNQTQYEKEQRARAKQLYG